MNSLTTRLVYWLCEWLSAPHVAGLISIQNKCLHVLHLTVPSLCVEIHVLGEYCFFKKTLYKRYPMIQLLGSTVRVYSNC